MGSEASVRHSICSSLFAISCAIRTRTVLFPSSLPTLAETGTARSCEYQYKNPPVLVDGYRETLVTVGFAAGTSAGAQYLRVDNYS